VEATSEAEVSGDRGRLAYALRTLLSYMLSRDTSPVTVKLRRLSLQAEIELSGAETWVASAPEDRVRAKALEAAADAQDSVRAVLSAHGGSLERTTAGFQLSVPLAPGTEAQP
jgi:hypothetical protein